MHAALLLIETGCQILPPLVVEQLAWLHPLHTLILPSVAPNPNMKERAINQVEGRPAENDKYATLQMNLYNKFATYSTQKGEICCTYLS